MFSFFSETMWGAKLERKNPIEMIQTILTEVDSFSEGLPQADDITIMAVKFSGNEKP